MNTNLQQLQDDIKTLSRYATKYSSIHSAINDIEDNINYLKDTEERNKINDAKTTINEWKKNNTGYVSDYEKDYIIWYVDYLEKKLQK